MRVYGELARFLSWTCAPLPFLKDSMRASTSADSEASSISFREFRVEGLGKLGFRFHVPTCSVDVLHLGPHPFRRPSRKHGGGFVQRRWFSVICRGYVWMARWMMPGWRRDGCRGFAKDIRCSPRMVMTPRALGPRPDFSVGSCQSCCHVGHVSLQDGPPLPRAPRNNLESPNLRCSPPPRHEVARSARSFQAFQAFLPHIGRTSLQSPSARKLVRRWIRQRRRAPSFGVGGAKEFVPSGIRGRASAFSLGREGLGVRAASIF